MEVENVETIDQYGKRGRLTRSQCGSVDFDVANCIPFVVGDALVGIVRFTLLWNSIVPSTP